MAGGSDTLEGPDLARGVTIDEVVRTGTLLGHAHGEPVLLVHTGGEVHAIGAKCAHYGGPLAEGVVEGTSIHCPWHHACFDVRTGETLRPPALNDVQSWLVERTGGVVRVSGRAPLRRPAKRPAVSPESVIIVGAGAAGDAAAETLRRLAYGGPVAMIDPDRDAPCDRPNLSKDYLAGNAPEEWIALHPPEFYDERQIEIVRTRAEAIIVADRTVVLGNGSRRRFDALILATGAEPVHLDIPASEGARVFYLRTLADSRAIIAAAQNGSRAVVIGAGFIGLEVAASLRHRNIDVHVVAMENVPLARVLGPELGSFVLHTHEEHGVTFHGGHTVHEIDAVGVTLDDGTRLDADFVVIGAGVRPRVALAESAGIRVDNGITVDEHLRTNVDGIFAAGDVASWPDPRSGRRVRIEHWAVAQMMGQTAARNVLGMNERFDTVPFFWSQHYDAVISSVGHAPEWDRADIDGDPSQLDCTVTLRQRGRRLAVVTIFRDGASLEAEIEMQREVRNPA